MRFVRTAIIAGAASAALAGAAFAAHDESKLMLIALPDGSVEHIRYTGDIAPQVVLGRDTDPAPADMFAAAFGPGSPFAEMDRISAAMEANARAMMRQAAMLQTRMPVADAEVPGGQGIVMTNAAGQPVGVVHYSYVSSTTDAGGCTQTVQYSSDGSRQQPRVIRTSAGSCGSDKAAPEANPVTPTSAVTAARPAPKITPVSTPELQGAFTPSRT